MGIAADASNKAFPSANVDRLLTGPRAQIPVDLMGQLSRYNTNHFMLAVDPSGGGSSAFAVCSMVQIATGQIIVRARRPRPHPRGPAESSPGARPPRARLARTPGSQRCLDIDKSFGRNVA